MHNATPHPVTEITVGILIGGKCYRQKALAMEPPVPSGEGRKLRIDGLNMPQRPAGNYEKAVVLEAEWLASPGK